MIAVVRGLVNADGLVPSIRTFAASLDLPDPVVRPVLLRLTESEILARTQDGSKAVFAVRNEELFNRFDFFVSGIVESVNHAGDLERERLWAVLEELADPVRLDTARKMLSESDLEKTAAEILAILAEPLGVSIETVAARLSDQTHQSL